MDVYSYSHIYVCGVSTNIYGITIDEKRGYEFEREQRGYIASFWGK